MNKQLVTRERLMQELEILWGSLLLLVALAGLTLLVLVLLLGWMVYLIFLYLVRLS